MSLKSIMIEHVEAVFVNAEHFGESVIFHAPAGDETVVCLVRIDGPSRDNEGDDQTIFTGEIDIPDAHVSALAIDGVLPALTCTVFAESWNIIDVGPAVDGMRRLGIRRDTAETIHSNAFNLDRTQMILQ